MSPDECLQKHTEDQILIWLAWLDGVELNRHGKLEHYLASIAAEARRNVAKDPGAVSLEHMLLTFGAREGPAEGDRELQVRASQYNALMAGGGKEVRVVTVAGAEAERMREEAREMFARGPNWLRKEGEGA